MFVCCDPFGYAMVNEAFWVNFVTDDDVELRGWVMHYEQSFGSSINYRQKNRRENIVTTLAALISQ